MTKPIITMDESTDELWLEDPNHPGKQTRVGFVDGCSFRVLVQEFTFSEWRAIGDFLGQLEGANLLSEVGE